MWNLFSSFTEPFSCDYDDYVASVYSLHFNDHFLGGPGLADTRMAPFWILLDVGGGSDSWSYKTCKTPVKSSPPTNHTQLFTGRMPFLLRNKQCLSTEAKHVGIFVFYNAIQSMPAWWYHTSHHSVTLYVSMSFQEISKKNRMSIHQI